MRILKFVTILQCVSLPSTVIIYNTHQLLRVKVPVVAVLKLAIRPVDLEERLVRLIHVEILRPLRANNVSQLASRVRNLGLLREEGVKLRLESVLETADGATGEKRVPGLRARNALAGLEDHSQRVQSGRDLVEAAALKGEGSATVACGQVVDLAWVGVDVVELDFVGAPDAVVEVVVSGDETEALVRVVVLVAGSVKPVEAFGESSAPVLDGGVLVCLITDSVGVEGDDLAVKGLRGAGKV